MVQIPVHLFSYFLVSLWELRGYVVLKGGKEKENGFERNTRYSEKRVIR